jgi:hypothetical protein
MVLIMLVASRGLGGGGIMCAVPRFLSDEDADEFVDKLRRQGPAGLAQALEAYDVLLERMVESGIDPANPVDDGEIAGDGFREIIEGRNRYIRAVDRIAGQRGATASRLYWYTDLDAAKAAAAENDKPILSLRLLGRLTDEYSCANSRFFRTALYTNNEISDYLRDNYVLHWQSVRPVPRVTIDFGDGRTLQRTLTGNSAHYVLGSAGRPLDVLPGLYGPQAFRRWLGESTALARRWADWGDDPNREFYLGQYHLERWQTVDKALRADLAAIAPQLLPPADQALKVSFVAETPPAALAAGKRAASKGAIEMPLLAAVLPPAHVLEAQAPDFWAHVGAAHAELAELDAASIKAMRRENPTAARAGAVSITKALVEDPLLQVVRNFQQSMAVDTIRNEYTLHQTVHRWFAEGTAGADFDALNERVYAELFLTPSSDPWLGLAPTDAYTALDGGGLSSSN